MPRYVVERTFVDGLHLGAEDCLEIVDWNARATPNPSLVYAYSLGYARRVLVRWSSAAAVCGAYLGYLLYMSVPVLPALDGPWLGGAVWYPEVALAVTTLILMFGNRHEAHVAAR